MSEGLRQKVEPPGRQAGAPAWVIQCDFDGTISRRDVIDSLLLRYGKDGWRALEEAWERGEIGSRECMQQQVALLDMSREELHASLAEIALDPGFAPFAAAARAAGIPVQIISDGLDYAIQVLLGREGLQDLPIFANHLLEAGTRGWRLENPWRQPGCDSGNCKCGHWQAQAAGGARVLYIGDGRSDFCVAGRADFVLAKASLLAHCRQQRLPHAAFEDFHEALALLPGILAPAARPELVS
ncbi:MtnX-like HAD-IB family phosphatase [Kerstersia sp.]|uniref:MtnX-like HAD-IB family phosphatase n=1 Tax=Kerstersia sp. TaxID=1930783 RepID=UPI003F8E18F5